MSIFYIDLAESEWILYRILYPVRALVSLIDGRYRSGEYTEFIVEPFTPGLH